MTMQYTVYPQYIPIVKWQKWERLALKNTEPAIAIRVLPCIEVRDSKQHQMALDEYEDTWKVAALVDYSNPKGLMSKDRAKELAQFLQQVKGSAAYVSPVLNPLSVPLVLPIIKSALGPRKITLRVRLAQLDMAADYVGHLKAALASPDLAAVTNRLIVDLGTTPSGVSDQDVQKLVTQLRSMKGLGFDYLHLASGAFPESLMHINGAGQVDRRDWKFWERVAKADPSLLVGYADYGPLTPEWSEEQLMRRGGRAVIRYALDDKWRVIRATTNTKADSIAISTLMTTIYNSEFKGAAFSFGDQLIADRANPALPLTKKMGGNYHITEYWNHHIAHVVKLQY